MSHTPGANSFHRHVHPSRRRVHYAACRSCQSITSTGSKHHHRPPGLRRAGKSMAKPLVLLVWQCYTGVTPMRRRILRAHTEMDMIRYHEPEDTSKIAELASAMDAQGWQGAPLVVVGDELLTGAHRHAAWMDAFGTDGGIPTIELADIFAGDGLSLDAVMEDEGCDGISEASIVYVLDTLPQETLDAYGIDVH